MTSPIETSRVVEVPWRAGLHIRPASVISQVASAFQSEVEIVHNGKSASAKGAMDILTLFAPAKTQLTIVARGPDAAAAVQAVVALFETLTDEPEQAAEPKLPAEGAAPQEQGERHGNGTSPTGTPPGNSTQPSGMR